MQIFVGKWNDKKEEKRQNTASLVTAGRLSQHNSWNKLKPISTPSNAIRDSKFQAPPITQVTDDANQAHDIKLMNVHRRIQEQLFWMKYLKHITPGFPTDAKLARLPINSLLFFSAQLFPAGI